MLYFYNSESRFKLVLRRGTTGIPYPKLENLELVHNIILEMLLRMSKFFLQINNYFLIENNKLPLISKYKLLNL